MKELKDLKGLLDSLGKLSIYVQIVSLLGVFVILVFTALNPVESFAKLPVFVQLMVMAILLTALVLIGMNPAAEAAIRDLLLTFKTLFSK